MSIITYPSLVGGVDVDSDRHVHGVSIRSVLTDTAATLRVKRALDAGAPAADPDGVVIGRCALADERTVAAAVAAAADAFPGWSRTSIEVRMRLGARIRERLLTNRKAFVDLMIAEGRTRKLAEWEIEGLLHIFSPQTLDWCAELLQREFTHADRRLVIRRRPDGVVCVAPPQNAPHSNAIYGAACLLSGNTVVVRAPRSVPLGVMYAMREIVAPALADVGAPPGTLNVVCGPPMMDQWLADRKVADIIYFGGTEKGLALQNKCVAVGKKPIVELAGNDCAVVWRDADLDRAVGALVEAFQASGQICNVPNQVVVHPSVADELIERLRVAAEAIRPGYPDSDVVLTPLLAADEFFACLAESLAGGAELVCGGRRVEVDGTESDTGFFVQPTVLRVNGLARARSFTAVREETFFPLLPVVVADPDRDDDALLDDVIEFVNTNRYGLRNSFFSRSAEVCQRVFDGVHNGGVLKIDDSTHCGFFPYLPSHGGVGLTGGAFGEASYMMIRTTHLQGVSLPR